jgi:hypothetical protein
MTHKHHVKKHHWVDGALKTVEHYFDTLNEAMEHAKSSDAHVVKVYNTDGELVHTTQTTGSTYA